MGKLNNNQEGFSAVEVVLVVVIVALIGVVGWLVYNHHKTTTVSTVSANSTKPTTSTNATTTPTQPASPYAGWQSFCSSYGGLCIKYPSNWKLKTTSEAASTTINTQEADITSPSGNVTVEYQPYCTQLSAPPSGIWTDNILSVTSPTSTSDFKIVKSVSSYQGNNSSNISESLYLTSNSVIQQYGISVGTHTNTTGNTDEAVAGFFANAKSSAPSNLQCLNVGSLKNSTGGNYLNFSSAADAKAWFSNSEAVTAKQILSSTSYNQ